MFISLKLLGHDRKNVALAHNQQIVTINRDFRSRILPIKNFVPNFHLHRDGFAVIGNAARTSGHNFAPNGLSFAVSGTMMPPLVRSSACEGFTMTRSANGLSVIGLLSLVDY
jgi:hypothetical protein